MTARFVQTVVRSLVLLIFILTIVAAGQSQWFAYPLAAVLVAFLVVTTYLERKNS